MKKFIKLLLVGLLSISLIGCSSGSSNSSGSDTSDTTSETETNVAKVNTTLSGNVMAALSNPIEYNCNAFDTSIDTSDIKTVTFLDSFDALPFEVDSDIYSCDISENEDGCVMLYADYSQDDEMYDVYIVGEGGVDANPSCCYLFASFKNCTSINFNGCFCTSNVTDMFGMFKYCYSLESLDVRSLDTSNVKDMEWMFSDCEELITLDLSNFDTSNVVFMNGMFSHCEELTTLDLSNFDTSKTTSMLSMFSYCISLSRLDLSSFDTSNVTNMTEMFYLCESLTDLDISNFDMSNVENDEFMFSNCPAGDNY